MKDKYFSWVVLPFFLINQLSFLPSEHTKEEAPVYAFEVGSNENEIVVENDSEKLAKYRKQKENFLSIEQQLTMLTEQPYLPSNEKPIYLGKILESMSGGILYGRKYTEYLHKR